MKRPTGESIDLSPLSALAPQLASTIASVASDVALVIDPQGVIRTVAFGTGQSLGTADEWVGRRWADTVTLHTRRKIEQLMEEALDAGLSQRREVSLPAPGGASIPVAYSAIRLGVGGPVLAVGRDLRSIAAIQQRFLDAQNEMERDYWKRRQAESRYRTLFEVATDAVFVVDGSTFEIVDANAAAARLFDLRPDQLMGKRATVGLDRLSRAPVEELLATARNSGRPAEVRARLAGNRGSTRLSATPFRSEGAMLLLLRAASVDAAGDSSDAVSQFAAMVERTSDGIAVCDAGGRVRIANPAFIALVGAASEDQVRGQVLSTWIGTSPDDVARLLTLVRQQGIARSASATLTPQRGLPQSIDIAAMLLPEGEQEAIGIIVHASEGARHSALAVGLSGAIAHVSTQLGLAELPTLMREVSLLAERHFLRTALERAGGDEEEAASLLGLPLDEFRARLREQQGEQFPPLGGAASGLQ